MRFEDVLARLTAPMDPAVHERELALLNRCRSLRDLERLAQEGWLSAANVPARLKLVRHGSGAFLVVKYEDGWSSTVSRSA